MLQLSAMAECYGWVLQLSVERQTARPQRPTKTDGLPGGPTEKDGPPRGPTEKDGPPRGPTDKDGPPSGPTDKDGPPSGADREEQTARPQGPCYS